MTFADCLQMHWASVCCFFKTQLTMDHMFSQLDHVPYKWYLSSG